MKKLIYLIAIFFSGFAYGQEVQEGIKLQNIEPQNIYESVDIDAAFPGGMNAFRQKFADNFNDKKVHSQKKNTIYRAVITFVVERDGSITDIMASGDNVEFIRESINAIKRIKEKWTSAKLNDTPVRQRYKFPIAMNFD